VRSSSPASLTPLGLSCVLSAARRWPRGRSWSLRTTRSATRWPRPASPTWGSTAAAPTATCREPGRHASPTCCCAWSQRCTEVSRGHQRSLEIMNPTVHFFLTAPRRPLQAAWWVASARARWWTTGGCWWRTSPWARRSCCSAGRRSRATAPACTARAARCTASWGWAAGTWAPSTPTARGRWGSARIYLLRIYI